MIDADRRGESAEAIRLGLRLTHWSIGDLWIAAAGIGASLNTRNIDDIATGRQVATPTEHDVLATALNEHLQDHGHDHPVRYWQDLRTNHH